MIYLNPFKNFDIKRLCYKYDIKNYHINLDRSITVDGNVSFAKLTRHKPRSTTFSFDGFNQSTRGLRPKIYGEIPLKFNRVDGDFYCNGCNLTTLKNAPIYVRGNFSCHNNKLKTLIGGPNRVCSYACSRNELKDIYGFPEVIIGNLHIDHNPVCEIFDILSFGPGKKVPSKILIKFIHLMNDNKVIRNSDTIIQDRLEEALYYIQPERMVLDYKKEFKNYKLI